MDLNLHQVLYLYETPNKFYIQPINEPKEALVLDRQNCEITIDQNFSFETLPVNSSSSLIDGIVGIKRLINCPYLIVITESSCIGFLNGRPVRRVEKTRIIPFIEKVNLTEDTQQNWEKTYVSMLESVLKTPNFYFSHQYDLTNSLQRNHDHTISKTNKTSDSSPQQYYDQRFLWNSHLMTEFNTCGKSVDKYRLPFILGFVSINDNSLGSGIGWSLVSRRGTRMAGTRFNTRGADLNGNVSNFVETEQIFEYKDRSAASFVQVRGSIPLLWSQKADYAYKPVIQINRNEDQDAPIRKHLDELKSYYGNVSLVCLIDQRGHEEALEHEFSQRMRQKYYNIPYHYFDFHKECSKMRWHRLSILLDRIQPEIESYGFFALTENQCIRKQSGVIRSNCIDSLDRTNVIQSMIAQKVLETQLNLFENNTSLPYMMHGIALEIFKNTWANNADALSIQYAGTPALKTDFTRTGQRTHAGAVKDGLNSLTRYVCNNFLDDYRQDAIDLFLGNYEGHPSPRYRPMELMSYSSTLPVVIIMLTLVALYLYLRNQ